MKIIDVISLDYNGVSESHLFCSTAEEAAKQSAEVEMAGHEGVRAEFLDKEELSSNALKVVGTGIPVHVYRRKDGKLGVSRK